MAKPEKPKQGCFSGFIRVLLCADNGTSPPVHPSDHVTEQDETELVHSKKDANFEDNAITPGLVARLMGLESLPKTNILMKGATPDSVTRSRSVNFVDYMLNSVVVGKDSHHRRVKTSASFREVPVPVPALARRGQEENDLVVFCWDDDVCKEHEVGFELRKMGIGFEELKQGKKQGKKQGNKNNKEIISVKRERNNNNNNQGKNKKISKLKNEPRRVPSTNHGKNVRNQSEDKGFSRYNCGGGSSSSSSSSSKFHNVKQKKEFVESCHKKRIRKEKLSKKMESDCNSENLSPVSVLENNGTNFLDGISPLASKSKWKSSSLKYSSDGVEDSASNNKGFVCAYTDINKEAEYYSELLLKLQTLTEQDIRELDCTTKRIYEYEEFEEIGFSFEHKILDLLLHEIVNELL